MGAGVVEVEQHPGRPRIAVARLADAARIEQPLAGGDVELGVGAPQLARHRAGLVAIERQRDVRVADQAHAMRLCIQAELGEQARQHVLPHRVTRARVIQADVELLRGWPQRRQILEVLGFDDVSRPARRMTRGGREIVERQLSGDRQIVVAGEADGRVPAREGDAGVRVAAVANEVAEAPDRVGLTLGDLAEDRFERVPVAVDGRMIATFIDAQGMGILAGAVEKQSCSPGVRSAPRLCRCMCDFATESTCSSACVGPTRGLLLVAGLAGELGQVLDPLARLSSASSSPRARRSALP